MRHPHTHSIHVAARNIKVRWERQGEYILPSLPPVNFQFYSLRDRQLFLNFSISRTFCQCYWSSVKTPCKLFLTYILWENSISLKSIPPVTLHVTGRERNGVKCASSVSAPNAANSKVHVSENMALWNATPSNSEHWSPNCVILRLPWCEWICCGSPTY
jgi:hypothetical protein